jgi:preprotein translocase subunit SecA
VFKIKQKLYEILIQKKSQNTKDSESIEKIYKEYQNFKKLETDIENLPYSLDNCFDGFKEFYQKLYLTIYSEWEKENKIVKELGGLFVLGTERHETRRIDNQLRGRAGRQGDPGISQFFVSLEDELIKVFGGENIKKWVEYLVQDKDSPLESGLLTKSLENAQKKIELYNYDLRKNVFQYDDILNNQRQILFQARNEILSTNLYHELVLRLAETIFDEEIKKEKSRNQGINKLEKDFGNYSLYLKDSEKIINTNFYKEIWITNDLRTEHANIYENNFLKNNRIILFLEIIDFYWTEHLERMSYIRETINWRSYGQQNPLVEYNLEAFKSFNLMFDQIESSMLYYSLNSSLNYYN